MRVKCGFGSLKQNAKLDQMAQNHADYLVANNLPPGHIEVAGLPGFTGSYVTDRANYVGYTVAPLAGVGEVVGATITNGKYPVWGLLGVPYHTALMLGGSQEIGVGALARTNGTYVVPIVFGGQEIAKMSEDAFSTWPCEGVTVEVRTQGAETPDPLPGVSWGYSLYASVRYGQILAVTKWTLTDTATEQVIDTHILRRANDPNTYLRGWEASLIPKSRLQANKTYRVEFEGTNNGKPISKTWTFKTVEGSLG